jgi:hypothetical protein
MTAPPPQTSPTANTVPLPAGKNQSLQKESLGGRVGIHITVQIMAK